MSTESPYPSRRALREQGLTTGSIQALTETGSIPPQSEELPPPLTRRERRERERLAETGSLPFPLPVTTPEARPSVDESPADTSDQTPEPPTDVLESGPPAATVAPTPAPATRPLTRRERREMERRGEPVPETGMIPVVAAEPAVTKDEVVPEAPASEVEELSEQIPAVGVVEEHAPADPEPLSPEEVLPTLAEGEVASSIEDDPSPDVHEPELEEPESLEPEPVEPAALPPVFAPTPSAEVHTASSQEVSVASNQTNALILPVAPAMDLTGPIGDTGEVLVTGNIPLPKQVSEQAITGIVEVDSDEYDVTDTGTFSNPIRATHAVSSRSLELAPPMIKKPRWGAASIVLAFSSAVLAVAAVGLLALALMTDLIALPSP